MDTLDRKPFGLNLSALKTRPKPEPDDQLAAVDRVGEAAGFVPRDPVPAPAAASVERGRGRPASPRTAQVHAKVLPDVAAEIAAQAVQLATTQGVVIEAAWKLYREQVLRQTD